MNVTLLCTFGNREAVGYNITNLSSSAKGGIRTAGAMSNGRENLRNIQFLASFLVIPARLSTCTDSLGIRMIR